MSGTKTINNPAGAYGNTVDPPSTEMEFLTTAAVNTAGTAAVVAINTAGSVAAAATNSTASLQVGITAKSASASGKTLGVVVQGFVRGVPCDGTVAAGDLLKRSVTTTGSVATTATPAAGEVIAVAIAASASNIVDVWVSKAAVTS